MWQALIENAGHDGTTTIRDLLSAKLSPSARPGTASRFDLDAGE